MIHTIITQYEMLTFLASTLLLIVTIKWWLSRKNSDEELLYLIPGADESQESIKRLDPSKTHLFMYDISKKYGPIACVRFPDRKHVILSDYDLIYKVLVKNGKIFGGRTTTFRIDSIFKSSGILFNKKPDSTWKMLRKLSQKHLRQFGDGLPRLQSLITIVADDMFDYFAIRANQPFNPDKIVFDAALNSIAFLICGRRTHTGEPLVEKMREYEGLNLKTLPVFAPWQFRLLDKYPWMTYIGFHKWSVFQRLSALHREIWNDVLEIKRQNPGNESICQILTDHLIGNDVSLSSADPQSASLVLLFAGVVTTSSSFYAAINILAHHQEVQTKLFEEIFHTRNIRNNISLSDRNTMPYVRAFTFELLRFTSILPIGFPHEALENCELQGYKIPAGTAIITNLWYLHHDEKFWKDPYEFRPERFLDDSGDVVPADHPHRTHLMPFGAGTRVCLGESLAMSRLFLWLTTLVERFEVFPAKGNIKSTTDPRNSIFEGIARPYNYEIILNERKRP